MIETLKKELLPGKMVFDLRNTLEQISTYSKMDVSIKERNITTNVQVARSFQRSKVTRCYHTRQ